MLCTYYAPIPYSTYIKIVFYSGFDDYFICNILACIYKYVIYHYIFPDLISACVDLSGLHGGLICRYKHSDWPTSSTHLPGLVHPSPDQQHSHGVGVQRGHLKLQLRPDPRPRVPPGFHGDQVGLGNAGVEAAVHQAAHVAHGQFIHLSLQNRNTMGILGSSQEVNRSI